MGSLQKPSDGHSGFGSARNRTDLIRKRVRRSAIDPREFAMLRFVTRALCGAMLLAAMTVAVEAQAQQPRAYGQVWGGSYTNQDWERFYHYPYVYYPQNFWGNEYYRSSDSLYYRYPPEMQIPVYNKKWHNYYPAGRRYHSGHHFILDVF